MASTPPPPPSGSGSGGPPSGAPFAPLPPPTGKSHRGLKVFGSILAAAALASVSVYACGGCGKLGGSNNSETAGQNKPDAPAAATATATANTDPLKPPPAPSATAVAAAGPESCGEGTEWNPTAKKCVGKVPAIPTAIAITVTPGCPPTNCPMASAAPVASASAPPASSGKSPPPAVVPTKVATIKVDLTPIGNDALFPSGQ